MKQSKTSQGDEMKRKRKEIESLTVGELIEQLQKLPKSLKVVGIDDFGNHDEVDLNFHKTSVYKHSVEYKEQEVVSVSIIKYGSYISHGEE